MFHACSNKKIIFAKPRLGSEIYQETLTKALAKHFNARLLIVDSLLLPGVSFCTSPLENSVYICIQRLLKVMLALNIDVRHHHFKY